MDAFFYSSPRLLHDEHKAYVFLFGISNHNWGILVLYFAMIF
ncbi:hypothetical protein SAMN05878482_11329 [Peribacillus simplex]|uniref:Uncharacterized protein n=1 Tax=Peribacillus simplex TaxID=1478 RepID=A0A9X8REH6_9BACI|nr:hypothetical protein SAMN05878482_11329 [Peribacillus simplex]